MRDEDVLLTPGERTAYAAELQRLIDSELPDLESKLRRLNAKSDTACDDDEYHDAIDDLYDTQTAIAYLRSFLGTAGEISGDEARRANYVRLGSRILVQLEDGVQTWYQIVGPFDADPAEGQSVSRDGAIGQALMNRVAGDRVLVETPAATYRLHIIRVEQSRHI